MDLLFQACRFLVFHDFCLSCWDLQLLISISFETLISHLYTFFETTGNLCHFSFVLVIIEQLISCMSLWKAFITITACRYQMFICRAHFMCCKPYAGKVHLTLYLFAFSSIVYMLYLMVKRMKLQIFQILSKPLTLPMMH